jgi:thioredoxin-dependent peroxiredoxin
MPKLMPGDKAPDFTATDQNGNTISLKDLRGKKVVLFFYPADDTPACTAEACNLRDNYKAFQAKGYSLLGVSPDDEKSHSKFAKKYRLPFSLLADTNKKIAKSYGVWGQKKLFGITYTGLIRTTFVIDEKGKIEEVIGRVLTKKHAGQILKASV